MCDLSKFHAAILAGLVVLCVSCAQPAQSRHATPVAQPASPSPSAATPTNPVASHPVPVETRTVSVALPAAPAPATGDATPTAAQASQTEALDSGRHPERLGPAIQPTTAFDPVRWRNDAAYAQRWLDTHEPGRVFQPAQPGEAVPAIRVQGDEALAVPAGGAAVLVVQAIPDAPVTFTSVDSGFFQGSRLASVTVRADADGLARAVFSQGAGTTGECRILAASPLASGQAHFIVTFNE